MKKLAFLLGIGLLILLMGQARAYEQDWFMSNQSSANYVYIKGAVNVSGNESAGAFCNTTFDMYADINSSSPYSYQFAFYIDGVLNYTNTQTASVPRVCFLLGSKIRSGGFYNFTASATALGGAIPIILYVAVNTTCFSNNSFMYLTSNNDANSIGWNMYEIATTAAITPNVTQVWDYPSTCSKRTMFTPKNLTGVISQYSRGYYVPFNSGSGNIIQLEYKFTVSSIGFATGAWRGGYYDIASNTTTELFYKPSVGTYAERWNLSLIPNHDYVAWIQYYCIAFTVGYPCLDHPVPDINVSVLDYAPNYVCGSFGNCTNGTQTRTCTDTGGVAPDIIQTISCLPVNQTIYLGFEDFISKLTSECIVGSTCFFVPVNITYNNPENPHWEIYPNAVIVYPPNQTQGSSYGGGMTGSEIFSNITVSPIAASWNRGTNFLKLWYQPPFYVHAYFEPNTSTYQCGNASGGLPSISFFEYVNATFLAALNFTFPSSTMSMFVDVRKCPAAPIQYTPPFYCLLAGGQACYGSCSQEPLGNYFIVVLDVTTGQVVLNYNDISIKENWTTIKIDVSNIINQNHNYRLILGVQPPNAWTFDANSYCSYFDNVRLFNQQFSTLETICLDMFGKPCDQLTPEQLLQAEQQFCSPPQECVGNDLYTNTLSNGVCISKIYASEPSCVAQTKSQLITGTQSIFLPIGSVCNSVINSTTNQTTCQAIQAEGIGFLLLFLTPIFWIMLIVIILMGVMSWWTKHMEIGIATGILLMIAMAAVFPELVWITIVFVLLAGFVAARHTVKAVQGGG
jgi:hypothetical protein